ncbi:MAG: hypothetical protein C4530_07535 [Desulfobacteraceae bacterium]|nr:MAG: hypothetical protein C4530_07535 [Desulfobacteraceae bacterium]
MPRKILAIDIKEDAVAAVLVKCGLKSRDIEAYAFIPSGEGIESALEAISGEMETAGADCVVSLPANRISFRNLNVPFKSVKKIQQILPFELEQTLALAISDFEFGFQAHECGEKKERSHVTAALIGKSELDGYMKILSDFGLQPERVTCGGYALAEVTARRTDFPCVGLVVEAARASATITLVADGKILLVRPVLIDTSETAQSLRVQIERTLPAIGTVCGIDTKPEAIFLTGFAFENEKRLAEMSHALGIPVHPIDVLKDTDIRCRPSLIDGWNPAQLNGAVSLAVLESGRIEGISFRTGRFDQTPFWGEYSRSLFRAAVLSGLILALAGFGLFFDSYRLNREARRLDREITAIFQATFPDVKRIVDPVHQMKVKIEEAKKSAFLPGESGQQIRTIDLINDLSRLIPAAVDVELTRLVVGPENLLIDGNTDNFNAVDDFKSRLESAKLFKAVTISSANTDRGENRIRFKLKGTF